MAKKVVKKEVIKVKKEVIEGIKMKEPPVAKIHLSKYFVLHSMTIMEKAFLTASPFRAEMHTEAEWEKIITSELNRQVK